MIEEKEMEKIAKYLNKAHKNQLLTIVQHINLFPLKNKMKTEEYIQYMNEKRQSGIVKYMLKEQKND